MSNEVVRLAVARRQALDSRVESRRERAVRVKAASTMTLGMTGTSRCEASSRAVVRVVAGETMKVMILNYRGLVVATATALTATSVSGTTLRLHLLLIRDENDRRRA